MNFDWKATLAKVAPVIATALGGPLAGVAVKVASDALGIEPNEDALAQAVASGDPNILLKLKEADNTFRVEMRRLGVKEKEIAAQDRASARQMAASTTLLPQVALATVFLAGFVAVLYAVFTGGAVLEDRLLNIAMFLLGILSAGISQIMNFFFGSSEGSKSKTAILGANHGGQ